MGEQESVSRRHLEVTGTVQGVGFRPYCYSLARQFQLSGWVCNHSAGVSIEIQGEACEQFIASLKQQPPPLAQIDTIHVEPVALVAGDSQFLILPSNTRAEKMPLPADAHLCDECIEDLFDPHSPFYHYPFVSCSHCGPRYSLIEQLPYDRQHTSMKDFPLCATCRQTYDNPSSRRFHAQTTACSDCGPGLSSSVQTIANAIRAGKIVALKGVGGFHLICDGTNTAAINELRQRKGRYAKPFAIMAANAASLRQWVQLNDNELTHLQAPSRPIMLLDKRPDCPLPEQLAPGLDKLGVMLPYSAVHYLLFNALEGAPPDNTQWLQKGLRCCLLVTSANRPGEVVIKDNEEAQEKLAALADLIVVHNRRIVRRLDDTVLQPAQNAPVVIRSGRGFTPRLIHLKQDLPPTLALGAYLKNTVCLAQGRRAYLSQHIGNLDTSSSMAFFEQTIEDMQNSLGIHAQVVAHDLHPDYYSSRYAKALALPSIAVQHHHAHIAAVVAEHGLGGPVLGLALDGFGWGEDAQSWGGELLQCQDSTFSRLGHLQQIVLAGGDKAAQQPWRLAVAFLAQQKRFNDIEQRYPHRDTGLLLQMLQAGFNCPSTSSAGRLFDCAAALLGMREENHYEAQAAMELESLVRETCVLENSWHITDNVLDFTPLLLAMMEYTPATGSEVFHGSVIEGIAQWVLENARQQGLFDIVLAGGCFLNTVLREGLIARLQSHGLRVYIAHQAPLNDGGIALGQAWIAGLRFQNSTD